MRVANIDKVKRNNVVTSMFASRGGLMKAVEVKTRCEYGPYGQEHGVEANVPRASLEISVDCAFHDWFFVPWFFGFFCTPEFTFVTYLKNEFRFLFRTSN